jgi:hypothetical protein
MAIHLNKPYRIVASKLKRYESHYHIPSDDVLIVPLRSLGSEVLCDIRWEDGNGELKLVEKAMFVSDNLAPLNEMLMPKLFDLWRHYYSQN